jgi:hypothetical protein
MPLYRKKVFFCNLVKSVRIFMMDGYEGIEYEIGFLSISINLTEY